MRTLSHVISIFSLLNENLQRQQNKKKSSWKSWKYGNKSKQRRKEKHWRSNVMQLWEMQNESQGVLHNLESVTGWVLLSFGLDILSVIRLHFIQFLVDFTRYVIDSVSRHTGVRTSKNCKQLHFMLHYKHVCHYLAWVPGQPVIVFSDEVWQPICILLVGAVSFLHS